MNRIFFRIVPLVLLSIAVAAFAIYFFIRYVFGDPLEDIARRQAAGPIFLLQEYIDHAPPDEWLVRLNKVREVSGLSLELIPLDDALAALADDRHAALRRGEVVLDIGGKAFYRRVDLSGDKYVGSETEVLQVRNLPIDVGLELKMDAFRYAIVALCVLIPIGIWSRRHWRELLALSKVADRFGQGQLAVRANTSARSGLYPLAQRMNQMAERIQELLAAHKSLLHSVSHELRTPISRIEFGLELLRTAKDDAAREARIQVMEEDVHELNALVSELLDLTKLEQGRSIKAARFALADMLRECADKLGHAFVGKELQLHLPEDLGEIDGERRLLARAVDNLLANAAKYAAHRVSLAAAKADEGWIEIVVEDDGPGIPADERTRVFEPFYRLDRSRDRATGGFGLGLAIAHKAVLLHGGEIVVGDSPLGGARFSVRIPCIAVV